MKSGAPDAHVDVFAVAEPELVHAARGRPEQSKNEIDFGFSGTEMSNSSMPAGCWPFFWVW